MAHVLGRLMAVLMAAALVSEAALCQEDVDQLASRLSAGDVSVLVAALKSPDSQMMTIEGSANDVFWSALEKQGLMRQHPLSEEMASKLGGTGLRPKIFSVTQQGHAELPALMARIKK